MTTTGSILGDRVVLTEDPRREGAAGARGELVEFRWLMAAVGLSMS